MEVNFAYDRLTTVVSSLSETKLDMAINVYREPVSFHGRVREPVLLRQLLMALQDTIVADFRSTVPAWLLDPVVTVHPDQVFFEAFSNDESIYARLSAPFDAFETNGPTAYGTTNIDFTWQLRSALQDLRSSRRTDLTIGAGGVGVATQVDSIERAHFERKVQLPDTWLRGFLQVQGALAQRAFTFDARPVDMLSMIAYLLDHQREERRGRSHAMRYEMQPDQPIRIVLEPWNEAFTLHGTHYTGYERTVRVWGRRRLELLQTILPYAQRVTIGVMGRGLPHFYICHCGAFQFVLVFSGWTRSNWSQGGSFDLLTSQAEIDPDVAYSTYDYLTQHLMSTPAEMSEAMGYPQKAIDQALVRLCRGGRVMYDVTTRRYRLRELFPEPLDVDRLFAPDPRIIEAQTLLERGNVEIQSIGPSPKRADETRSESLVRDGEAIYKVSVSVGTDDHIHFGQCQCQFFRDNIMSRGPCKHILAARLALAQALTDNKLTPTTLTDL